MENNHLLPVYPCNVVMWMLLIVACMKEKKGLWFDMLAEFCFYGGTVCGVLGIVLNTNFDNTPTLADYDVLKGLLSHSTMLFGCLYMLIGGYIRIRVFNSVSIMAGLLCFISCGMAVDSLYIACGMEAPDGMWLRSNEYVSVPPLLLGALAPVIVFIVLSLWELRLPSDGKGLTRHGGRGVCTLNRDGLTYTGTKKGEPFSFHIDIVGLPTYGMCTDLSRFYTFLNGEFVEFYPENKVVEKFFLATEELHRLNGGKWKDFDFDRKTWEVKA